MAKKFILANNYEEVAKELNEFVNGDKFTLALGRVDSVDDLLSFKAEKRFDNIEVQKLSFKTKQGTHGIIVDWGDSGMGFGIGELIIIDNDSIYRIPQGDVDTDKYTRVK